jgi:hypothetical protein
MLRKIDKRDSTDLYEHAVVQRAKELVDFARQHGYRTDELIEIIEDVG